jgi:putative PIG3 family NAD(P)H quinone oxidoreductase
MSKPLPTEMQAVAAPEPGGADRLKLLRRPLPKPAEGELLVRVAAAGVNRPDILQREGNYAPPPGSTDILGLELAGEVVAKGSGDAGPWRIGDRLCALVAGGGYAEYCAVPAPQALPIPKGLSLVEAAGLPETFFTVWTNVFQRGRLAPGETFLVHGGTSGIGTTAIQLAHAFGARVIATAGGAGKAAACRSLGADRAIDYKAEDFVAAVKDFTGGRGADVILDMVGGDYVQRNLKCLALEGRLVQIAFLKGSKTELDLMHLMLKRQTLTGSTLRPRSVAEKGAIAAELRDRVWPWIEAGRVKPVIHKTFPLAEAADAHRLLEAGTHIGKIVLTVG